MIRREFIADLAGAAAIVGVLADRGAGAAGCDARGRGPSQPVAGGVNEPLRGFHQ
jgi:hypothetical protein